LSEFYDVINNTLMIKIFQLRLRRVFDLAEGKFFHSELIHKPYFMCCIVKLYVCYIYGD